jgi:triphosphoribosyl-dephospho-CoA synthase
MQSAHAIATPLTAPDRGVGERILAATLATQQAVGCNTNLGIVLAGAPLVQAAWLTMASGCSQQIDFIQTLRQALQDLTNQDAEQAYAAIRLANPGGLGTTEQHDVRNAPSITLLQAMQAAAARDAIAQQYATGYADVFSIGVLAIDRALMRGWSEEWATVACYLAWLAHGPDTHVARKFGLETAQQLSREAVPYRDECMRVDDPQQMTTRLLAWDAQLKQRGLNPGTSADLTVTSILARSLQQGIQQQPVTQCGAHVALAW